MRKAETLLNIIRDRGKRGLVVKDIYRMLYQKDLYLTAYAKLYKNNGAMTKGATMETVDGMSMEKINNLIELLRFERYRWTPVRRIYIPKKGKNQMRPLGLPSYSDKLLQEVIRLILEAYYEPQFSESSHGFRPGRGCHTALQMVSQKGSATKWFIEGDIKACFDRIDHTVLIDILKKDFQDNRFISLMKNLLQAGYLENWVYNRTYSGVPQGSIVGPVLTNLVLNQLDKFMEKEIAQFNKGTIRKRNPEYKRINERISYRKRDKKWEEVKALRKVARSIPSVIPDDPSFKRLWYVRYADDWLAGVKGTKTDAEWIRGKVRDFLKHELKLELSEEKTLITHARSEQASFLGYHIRTMHCDTKITKGKRSINGLISFSIPPKVIKEKKARYMKNGKPIHLAQRIKDEPYSIISSYQSEYRGVVQYYKMAQNLNRLNHLRHTMETSLVKTLANKYKTTCRKIYREYGATKKLAEGTYKILQVIVPRPGKKPLETHFGVIPLIVDKRAQINDSKDIWAWNKRTEVIERLLADTCELCGNQESIEMHHIRKLADIKAKDGKPVAEWKYLMNVRQRKSLAVCRKCHNKIHRGEYDGTSLKRITTGEPRDLETVTRGSERDGWKSNSKLLQV